MAEKCVVMLVRRGYLTDGERKVVEQHFPGAELHFRLTNPQSPEDHLANCREHRPNIIFLPQKPLLVPAMEVGFHHVIVISGQLMELMAVKPEFKPFKLPGSGPVGPELHYSERH